MTDTMTQPDMREIPIPRDFKISVLAPILKSRPREKSRLGSSYFHRRKNEWEKHLIFSNVVIKLPYGSEKSYVVYLEIMKTGMVRYRVLTVPNPCPEIAGFINPDPESRPEIQSRSRNRD